MPRNKDKIRYRFAECQAEITCAVCRFTFWTFPCYDIDDRSSQHQEFFECPKCKRKYEFKFSIEVVSNEKDLQKYFDKDILK